MTVQRYSSKQSPSTFRKECNHLTANFLAKFFQCTYRRNTRRRKRKPNMIYPMLLNTLLNALQ